MESDAIDRGAEVPASHFDSEGKWVEVVRVHRRVVAFVAFEKREGAPYDFPITYVLWSARRPRRSRSLRTIFAVIVSLL